MKTPYYFSILRYVHDTVSQEFVNIGVVVYSKEARYLRAHCTTHYARISSLFTKIDGNRFRSLTRYIQDQVNAIGDGLASGLPFDPARTMEQLLARVLPPDDSALQFSAPPGAGLSRDLDKTLADLFERYVERYALRAGASRRDDEDIWRTFREPLEQRHVAAGLQPKRIAGADYEHDFQRAWKNEIWHVYEPVSFDLLDSGSIVDKANRWLGRATSLADASETFAIHFLLGEPQDRSLTTAFSKARNILGKIPTQKELVSEQDAESFANRLADQMLEHAAPKAPGSKEPQTGHRPSKEKIA